MAHLTVRMACLVTLLAVTSSAKKEQSRWSRQISSYTSDISDWVPLSGPMEKEPTQPQIKGQAVAEPRILTEPFPTLTRPTGFGREAFPSRGFYNTAANRQLYLQSVPSVPTAPQNFLTEQGFGQSIRFGLSQPNYPLMQGFVAPPFTFESPPAPSNPRPQPIPASPVNFPQSGIAVSPQAKPFGNQGVRKPDLPKFVDGYKAENVSGEFAYTPKKKPQSLQKIKFDNAEKPPRVENIPQNTKVEREEVQLLYVPLESLNRGQFNFRSPITSPQVLNSELYSQGLPKPNPPKFTFANEHQRPVTKPVDNFQGHNYFPGFNTHLKENDSLSKFSTISTPFLTAQPTTTKPKKLKPHQPPLAIFMTKETAKTNQVKVGDVLSSLKNADTVAVLDSVNPLNAPKVFIGPSNLPPPENFVKFELPYLSNIENSEKKLKQLPFFVAPLSYNTPQGFAKIPFPSPHVGSVVINSFIRDNTQNQSPSQATIPPNTYITNSYTQPLPYKPETKPTQKPTFSFFSTIAPNEKPISNHQANYYSFEPQTVSTIRPVKQPEIVTPPPKTGSYFLSNIGSQYNSNEYINFAKQDTFKSSEAIDAIPPAYNIHRRPETTTTLRTTTTTTTTTPKPPSTYPSQLLETHNPYSINQAFHFSTPLDYHNDFDDIKEPYPTPSAVDTTSPSHTPSPISPTTPPPKSQEIKTEKPKSQQQSTLVYLQNYSPEIHINPKEQSWRYPVFNPNDYIEKTELSSQQTQASVPVNTDINPSVSTVYSENNENVDTQPPAEPNNSKEVKQSSISEFDTPSRYEDYSQYETNFETTENPTTPITMSTPTTRRAPLRSRGRPRYTTTSRAESYESTTRTIVTRRPFRERRPLPTRPKYEPNRIINDNSDKKPLDSNESTTRPTRTRTRGRIQYRPTGNDEIYDRRIKAHNSKEDDLAYQRDVLHQNYPVTLMERTSPVDIEAITEPTPSLSSTKTQETITEVVDTENAYTNERVSISQHVADAQMKPEPSVQTFTSRTPRPSEESYVPKLPSTRNEEYFFSRSSEAPEHKLYEENSDQDEDIYVKHTAPEQKLEKAESNSYITEPATASKQDVQNFSASEETAAKQEETTTTPEVEVTKVASQEFHEAEEEDDNVVQTTPSYNRVRVRPGVIRQYHQATSESPRIKERRRQQAVTYRPAFDRRRTTMRIDEIEADLKTKQVHSRPDFQDDRHPVYKPELINESSALSSTTEATTRRSHFRRRRPTYSTTSTEASNSAKRIYEVKNRFRGRRPTEKPTENPDVQTEVPTSTVRNSLHTRYSHRPRLSERYNKKPEPEAEAEEDDQESNFSINRPKYVEPNADQWSPKISIDSFKPYSPNNIVDERKVATTERRTDKENVLDIITARNEYEDVLISVTPASNRLNKKMPDIPPTLEAFVEQAKVTKSESGDGMSTFESMLEEVMKSLEDQDRDEYSTNVMKHKGGEIGEIPPERIITSGDNYLPKSTTNREQETTTTEPSTQDSAHRYEEDDDRKKRRRGFWKKVKVRPATTESIEFAESQYYTNTVNRLGHPLKSYKTTHNKSEKSDKPKVTTYKPKFEFIEHLFEKDYDTNDDVFPNVDIRKINSKPEEKEEPLVNEESQQTTVYVQKEPQIDSGIRPGDLDLGTGSPDPTLDDLYYTTEAATAKTTIVDRSDGYSFMDYLFGVTSEDNESKKMNKTVTKRTELEIQTTTEQPKSKIVTTETTFMPEEITAVPTNVETTDDDNVPDVFNIDKSTISENNTKMDGATEISVVKVESSSVSSFINPANVVSTSKSTEISHETEICFRGKCIKTSKDIL